MRTALGARIVESGGLLFGRRTYQDVVNYWNTQTDSPFTDALSTAPKDVGSPTLREPLPWPNSTLLRGDAADAVAELKEQPGKDLHIMGSGQSMLMIHPSVLGSGCRLVPDDSPHTTLRLVDTETTSTRGHDRDLPAGRTSHDRRPGRKATTAIAQRLRRRKFDARPGWAVVTGASSGLGREFSRALARRGHPVLAVARREERLRALAEEIGAIGGDLEPLVADLSTTVGIEELLARAAPLDVELLVNNAGVATYGRFSSTPVERELELVRLNVEAIVALTDSLLPALLARGQGGVINVASQMAFQPMPYFAAYAGSKAFVLSFSEALAEELRGTGVRVTAVAPGFVSTEFAKVAGSQAPERRFPHLQPRRVVEAALRAHDRGRTVKVVGAPYAFLTFAGRFAPRAVLRRMMRLALRPAPTIDDPGSLQ